MKFLQSLLCNLEFFLYLCGCFKTNRTEWKLFLGRTDTWWSM